MTPDIMEGTEAVESEGVVVCCKEGERVGDGEERAGGTIDVWTARCL
jgi:hypothetical protein